jgi:hypothetical protein
MASFYNDSSFSTNYGTVYLPVTGSNVTGLFLAESLTINQPSTTIDLRNQLNEPAGRIAISDFEHGNTTLQVSGAFPALGATFGFNSTVYYLSEVGRVYAQNEVFKSSVTFLKKYN